MTVCMCMRVLLKDLLNCLFFRFKPVDQESEAALRGIYCINTLYSALPCDFYCTVIVAYYRCTLTLSSKITTQR